MRKTKEVLRLRFELELGQRQIARSCGMGLGTSRSYTANDQPRPTTLRQRTAECSLTGYLSRGVHSTWWFFPWPLVHLHVH